MKRFLLLLLLVSNLVFSQDGNLETSFGDNGYVLFDDTSILFNDDIQSDGKFLYQNSANGLYRLNSDGSQDITFGNSGVISFVDPGNYRYTSVNFESENKINVISKTLYSTYYMTRYNYDGTIDTSLGANGEGYITIDLDDIEGSVLPKISLDNKLILAGNSSTAYGNYNDIYARKFNLDGTLDTSFNYTIQNIGVNYGNTSVGYATDDFKTDFKLLSTGESVIGVRAKHYGGSTGNAISYRSGFVLVNHGSSSPSVKKSSYYATESTKASIFIGQSDDIYLLTGAKFGSYVTNVVEKWNSTGTKDATFGELNLSLEIGTDIDADFKKVIVQPDNKILAAGVIIDFNVSTNTFTNLVMARFLSDGTLDTTFGSNGYVLYDIPNPTTSDDKNTFVNLLVSDNYDSVYLCGRNYEKSVILKYLNESAVVSTQDNVLNNTVSVYPNPSKNKLFIDAKGKSLLNKEYSIYDTAGRIIKSAILTNEMSGVSNIDLTELKSGLYFIQFENSTENYKFIIE